MKNDDHSTNISSLLTPHKLRTSKINLYNNLHYSLMCLMIMQSMVTDAASIEKHPKNLEKSIDGQTKYVQNQNAQIDKLVDTLDVIIDRYSSHALGKTPKVH